jgi:hypothetical protein
LALNSGRREDNGREDIRQEDKGFRGPLIHFAPFISTQQQGGNLWV